MLLKFAVSCEAQHMTSSQCKAYLGAVVVLLYAGNAAEAQATYQVGCQCRGAGLTPGICLPCTTLLSVQPVQVATCSVWPCLWKRGGNRAPDHCGGFIASGSRYLPTGPLWVRLQARRLQDTKAGLCLACKMHWQGSQSRIAGKAMPAALQHLPSSIMVVLQDALAVESFTSSKEAFAADDLMEAYRSGDAAHVQKVVATNFLFRELDNQVSSQG